MFFLVPTILYGWILITIYLFFTEKKIERAILISLVFGQMFLPVYSFNLPLLIYNKKVAISLGILFGTLLKGGRIKKIPFLGVDFFVLYYCSFGLVLTSLLNGLGLYDGIYSTIQSLFRYGIFYFVGRRYFYDKESISKITDFIFFGALIYAPLCYVELIMSPQLSRWIYGFHGHSFLQHIRGNGYRPMVFMQHGLMVSLWMASGTLISLAYWLEKRYKRIFGIPMAYVFFIMLFTTYSTKSSGASVLLTVGIFLYLYYHKKRVTWHIRLVLYFVILYLLLRVSGHVNSEVILVFLSKYFSVERIESLWFRLFQEDLYLQNMTNHVIFGWGGWDRSAPIDPRTGRLLIVRDSMWLNIYSQQGLAGLISVYIFFMAGANRVLSKKMNTISTYNSIVLAIIIVLFCFDTLLNAMINPVYIFCAGALLSYHQKSMKKTGTELK